MIAGVWDDILTFVPLAFLFLPLPASVPTEFVFQRGIGTVYVMEAHLPLGGNVPLLPYSRSTPGFPAGPESKDFCTDADGACLESSTGPVKVLEPRRQKTHPLLPAFEIVSTYRSRSLGGEIQGPLIAGRSSGGKDVEIREMRGRELTGAQSS